MVTFRTQKTVTKNWWNLMFIYLMFISCWKSSINIKTCNFRRLVKCNFLSPKCAHKPFLILLKHTKSIFTSFYCLSAIFTNYSTTFIIFTTFSVFLSAYYLPPPFINIVSLNIFMLLITVLQRFPNTIYNYLWIKHVINIITFLKATTSGNLLPVTINIWVRQIFRCFLYHIIVNHQKHFFHVLQTFPLIHDNAVAVNISSKTNHQKLIFFYRLKYFEVLILLLWLNC